MTDWTVSELARMAGVSVRTLHHYDAIGLLRPARVGANGYRHYGREELLRLQQVLIHRELDIPLERIAAILDDPAFDRLSALRVQRAALAAKAARYATLLQTIDRAIANEDGARTMQDEDLYAGLTAEKQAEYEDWLVKNYGERMTDDIARSKAAAARRTPGDHAAAMAELEAVEQALAQAMREGAAGPVLASLLDRHRAWVGRMWGRPCPPDAYAGLADLYGAHPDFIARFETIAPGFCGWLTAAMTAHAHGLEQTPPRG